MRWAVITAFGLLLVVLVTPAAFRARSLLCVAVGVILWVLALTLLGRFRKRIVFVL